MNQPLSLSAEVEALCGVMLEEQLSDQQRERLEHLVLTSSEAKQTYIEYINLHAAIYRYNSANVGSTGLPVHGDSILSPMPTPSNESTKSTHSPVIGFVSECVQQSASFLFRSNIFAILVAIGLPSLVLAVLVVGIVTQPPPETPAAMITAMHQGGGCVSDSNGLCLPYSGMGIYAGQQISLENGLIELRFADGAKAVLEAPTTFDIRGTNAGYLRAGRLSATVPPAAHGFTIKTPHAQVVDLGTDFGVSVAKDGTAEAHVFKGKVSVAANKTSAQPKPAATLLTQGQAAKIELSAKGHAAKIIAMAASPRNFVRRLPKPKKKIHFVHLGNADPTAEGWRLQVLTGTNLVDASTDPSLMSPFNDRGTLNWRLDNQGEKEIRYTIDHTRGFSRGLINRAKKNGWIMRARIKACPIEKGQFSICHCIYHDDTRTWAIFPNARDDGSQFVSLLGQSSRGINPQIEIPNSRDRYIDYEVRYRPATNDADVYVDGRLVATHYFRHRDMPIMGMQFGLQRRPSKAEFAMIEWECLEDGTPAKAVGTEQR